MCHFLLLNGGKEEGIIHKLVRRGSLGGVRGVVDAGQVWECEADQPGVYAVALKDIVTSPVNRGASNTYPPMRQDSERQTPGE